MYRTYKILVIISCEHSAFLYSLRNGLVEENMLGPVNVC
jgi:hypothetical protein